MKTYLYLSIFSAFALVACNKQAEVKTEVETEQTHDEVVRFTPEQLKQVEIVTTSLQEKELSKTITVNGITKLKPENEMEVSSLIDGQFKNSKLLEGMLVTKGQVVAQLDNLEILDWQEQYLVAKAKHQVAKADYERQAELNKTQSASNKVLQQAKFEYKQQAILIQTLGSKLQALGINIQTLNENNIQRSLPIRAPFTGYIDQVMVTNGTYITSNTPLFKIINAKDLLLQLKVYEADLPFLKVDQSIFASTNNNKTEREGKIAFINTQLTPEGYGEIICTVQNQTDLTPGMYVTAKIELAKHKTYAVPTDAIISFADRDYVFVQENETTFKPVEVQIGVIENGFTAIQNAADLLDKQIVYKNAYAILMQGKNLDEE
ncbi:efflux RND transporter periplasmic adaptor subunit [Flavobacterium agricola]|uniref:Efflux RND transporter periplasmic adaptor subunit n=1 Tax=Flavobacterium agricola TaxID=2870839 RepID=A0ABY6M007_9FLAO|nr:efflux RND transporter periplasmic adaptor subunit [Flavobacterium agricola]UYW01880.1 efflux RND transporter periplasmic adaptor subunit [Flavobacterium agricola]